jgi:hypothetical protein
LGHNDFEFELCQFPSELGKMIVPAAGPSGLQNEVLPLKIAEPSESVAECCDIVLVIVRNNEQADPMYPMDVLRLDRMDARKKETRE